MANGYYKSTVKKYMCVNKLYHNVIFAHKLALKH